MNLSIKNVPEDVVDRLRQRAKLNHRSLQGELAAIVEEAARIHRPFDAYGLLAEVRRRGVKSPGESTAMIREDRDSR